MVFIPPKFKPENVKYENIYLDAYADGGQLYQGLNQYFEFYNAKRLLQSLNYKTPESVYLQAA